MGDGFFTPSAERKRTYKAYYYEVAEDRGRDQ